MNQGIEKKMRNCDKCGSPLAFPGGYLLDVRTQDLEMWRKLRNLAEFAANAGAVAVTKQSDPVWFVCEACLIKSGDAHGVAVDPVIKVMSSARAKHFWETGEWERPMLVDDFPPESHENRLPWMNPALEEEWRKDFGREPALQDYLAIRAAILGRYLAQVAHRAMIPNNPWVTKPQAFVLVIAEMGAGWSWDKYLLRFIERRLLARIGSSTKVWFVSYREATETWFTYRMLPYVATSVANALGQNLAELKFECYIDNNGRCCLTVLG